MTEHHGWQAKYPGVCATCGNPFPVGARVKRRDTAYHHEGCVKARKPSYATGSLPQGARKTHSRLDPRLLTSATLSEAVAVKTFAVTDEAGNYPDTVHTVAAPRV